MENHTFIYNVFPELAESKDEKIRNLIKDMIISFKNGRIYNVGAEEFGNCLAWLETQKKQEQCKPSIWKHWSGNGIAGNGEGKQTFLIKLNKVIYIVLSHVLVLSVIILNCLN